MCEHPIDEVFASLLEAYMATSEPWQDKLATLERLRDKIDLEIETIRNHYT
jgi:hypothetical protein